MSDNSNPYQILNFVLASLMKKIVVPTDFHSQVECVKTMLKDDVSGLIDVLTDFAVSSASVDYCIESENEEYNKILKKWTEEINLGYQGRIPPGLVNLAKEYFKERWKGSSFPVLKIAEWGTINNILFPTKMFFVDGGSIHARDLDSSDKNLNLINYDYYLADKEKLDKNVIFSRPYGRWFDEYPTPYLIKRGVYHNYRILLSLKQKQTEILEQVIPYLLLIKKGSPELLRQGFSGYTQPQLEEVLEKIETLINKVDNSTADKRTPARATNFDEEIKHLIPDLEVLFKESLFTVIEKNILSALGFIDIAEGISSSRRESILNPKVFIEEVRTGIKDFKNILFQLIVMIKEKNSAHVKWMNSNIHICSSPITAFMTDDFKDKIRQLYDRGRVSSQTAVELIAEIDFETEVYRRKRETIEGTDLIMYPPIRDNREDTSIDFPSNPESDTDEEAIPDDKKDDIEKENYDIGKLEGAPYETVKQLPSRVKDNLTVDLQRVYMRVFNNAYDTYENDTMASRVAWNIIKKIGRKGKNGKWYRKRKRANGSLKEVSLNKSMIQDALDKAEKEAIDHTIKERKIEIEEKQNKLLDLLLKNRGKHEGNKDISK